MNRLSFSRVRAHLNLSERKGVGECYSTGEGGEDE